MSVIDAIGGGGYREAITIAVAVVGLPYTASARSRSGLSVFARLDPDLAMRRIIRQANALGSTVRFDPIHAPDHPHHFGTAPETPNHPGSRDSPIIFGPAPSPPGDASQA